MTPLRTCAITAAACNWAHAVFVHALLHEGLIGLAVATGLVLIAVGAPEGRR